MRQYSPEHRVKQRGRSLDIDMQLEQSQREQVQEVRKALHIGKKFYHKAKKITERFPMPSLGEAEGALGAGDHVLNVAGQTVGISGLHDLPTDPTGFLAECKKFILDGISEFVQREGLLDDAED
jgi:hypothetical protein